MNETEPELKQKTIPLCLGCNQNQGRRLFWIFLFFFLNVDMPLLDQTQGSKSSFLLRLDQTRGKKYIKFSIF